MPGCIQVSVLGFNGAQTASASSDTFIKVSMGKTEYQTWDTGDFTFPVTTLREKLIVTLVDANGNTISHTEMETRLIIEKGFLEDKFSLEDGGNVHLKLRFVLSEEDRDRIRFVRQSALRKKHDELVNGNTRKLKVVASGSPLSDRPEVSDPGKTGKNIAADELANLDTNPGLSVDTEFKTDRDSREPSASSLMTQQPDKTQNQPTSSEVSWSKKNSGLRKLEMNKNENLGKHSELEKSLSKVRKMISTFETGVTRDKKLQAAEIETGSYNDSVNRKNSVSQLQRYLNLKRSKGKKNSSEDMQKSVCTNKGQECDEKMTVSGKMEDKNFSSNKQRRRRSSVSERKDEKEVSLKNPNRTHGISSNKLIYRKDSQHFNVRGSRLWIFPDGTKDSCITTSGRRHMAETAVHQRLIDSFVRDNIHEKGVGSGAKLNNGWENIERSKKPRSDAFADSKNYRGPVGQVMRAVIMVGFATLVLVTRQRDRR